jgi:hypothetical protein
MRRKAFGIIGVPATSHAASLIEMSPRRRHRRHHLHRLGHRLRQAQRQHERRADHAARAHLLNAALGLAIVALSS